LLAEHFLRHFNIVMSKSIRGVLPAARQKLLAHHWPGNVRELRNVMERAVILEMAEEVQPESLPEFQLEARLRKGGGLTAGPPEVSLETALANYERELILSTLEQNNFNLNRTAEQLRISRHALRYRIQRLNIETGMSLEEETSTTVGKDSV
jgi:transcriptional regulator with PAS, ATPase and Fis domain